MKLLLDEHIDPAIARGLRRLIPDINLLSVQEADLRGLDDASILYYASREQRVVVSMDRRTMSHEAIQRIEASEPMPGLILIRPRTSLGDIIRALELVVICADETDMENAIVYLPL